MEERSRAGARAFWRYWTSSAASTLGDAVTEIAMPLVALHTLHGSPFEVSLVVAAGYAAWLLIGLPAGVIVSRLPPRGLQVGLDLARAAVLVTVPIAAWTGWLTLAQLVLVAFVVNVATVLFAVANMTFLPAVVPKEELTARNSVLSATNSATQVAGPGLGGFLVNLVGAASTLIADVVSYVISAVMLARLPRSAPAAPGSPTSMRRQIAEGWRFISRHPVMGPCLVDATLVNFILAGFQTLTPIYLVTHLHVRLGTVGLVVAIGGLGATATASVVPRVLRRYGTARASIGAGVLGGVCALMVPLGHGMVALVTFTVGLMLYDASVVIRSVAYFTHRQTETPGELLPRVLATARFVSWGAAPFGALLAGVVASRSSIGAVWLFVALTVVGPAFLLCTRVRRLRDLAPTTGAAEAG